MELNGSLGHVYVLIQCFKMNLTGRCICHELKVIV